MAWRVPASGIRRWFAGAASSWAGFSGVTSQGRFDNRCYRSGFSGSWLAGRVWLGAAAGSAAMISWCRLQARPAFRRIGSTGSTAFGTGSAGSAVLAGRRNPLDFDQAAGMAAGSSGSEPARPFGCFDRCGQCRLTFDYRWHGPRAVPVPEQAQPGCLSGFAAALPDAGGRCSGGGCRLVPSGFRAGLGWLSCSSIWTSSGRVISADSSALSKPAN